MTDSVSITVEDFKPDSPELRAERDEAESINWVGYSFATFWYHAEDRMYVCSRWMPDAEDITGIAKSLTSRTGQHVYVMWTAGSNSRYVNWELT